MFQRSSVIEGFLLKENFPEATIAAYGIPHLNQNKREDLLFQIFQEFETFYEADGIAIYLELMNDNHEGVFFILNYLRYLFRNRPQDLEKHLDIISKIPSLELLLISLSKIRDHVFSEKIVCHDNFVLRFEQLLESQDPDSLICKIANSKYPQLIEVLLRRFDALFEFRDSNGVGILEHAVRDSSAKLISHLLHREDIFKRLCDNSKFHPILIAANCGNLLLIKILLDRDLTNKDICDDGMNQFQHWLLYSFNIMNINYYSEGKESAKKLGEVANKILEHLLVSNRVMPSCKFSLCGRSICHFLFLSHSQETDISKKIDVLLPVVLKRDDVEIWTRRDNTGASPIRMLLDSFELKVRLSFLERILSYFAPKITLWNQLIEHFREPDIFKKLIALYFDGVLDKSQKISQFDLILLETVVFHLSKLVVIDSEFFLHQAGKGLGNKKLEDLSCNLYLTYVTDQFLTNNLSCFLGFAPSFMGGAKLNYRDFYKHLLSLKNDLNQEGAYEYLENIFAKLNSTHIDILELKKSFKAEFNQFRSKSYKLLAYLSEVLSQEKFDSLKEFAEISGSLVLKERSVYLMCSWISSSEFIEGLRRNKQGADKLSAFINEMLDFILPEDSIFNLKSVLTMIKPELQKTHYTVYGYQK